MDHRQVMRLFTAGLSLSICAWTSLAYSRPAYVNRVPTQFGCETCHLDPQNRNLRTGFGIDFGLSRGVWARDDDPEAGICGLDSDADGLTNGDELADPDCLWRPGQAVPRQPVTNPADGRDPDQCGDGMIQGDEACDGNDFGGRTCMTLGFQEGELRCLNDCRIDQDGCIPLPEPDAAIPLDMAMPMDTQVELDQRAIPEDMAVVGLQDLSLRADQGMPEDASQSVDDQAVGDAMVNRYVADGPVPLDADSLTSDSRPQIDATDGAERNKRVSGQGCQSAPKSSLGLLFGCLLLLRPRGSRGGR